MSQNSIKLPAIGLAILGLIGLGFMIAVFFGAPSVKSPETAAERRRKTLSSRSVELLTQAGTRVAEARRLGEAKVQVASPVLAQLCKDGDPEFRKACVWAIGNIGDKEGVHALRIRVYDEDVGVRTETATAFGKLYNHVAFQGLRDMMEDESPLVREAAAKAFGDNHRDKLVIKELEKMLADKDAKVRAAAIAGLVKSPTEDATFSLIKALTDPEPGNRMVAATEIAKRRDPAAYEGLGWILGHSDATVRAAAAEAIRQIGKPILPYLKNALTTTKSLEARAEAVVLLGAVGGPEAVPALIGMLDQFQSRSGSDEIARLRESVLKGLTSIGLAGLPAISEEVMLGEHTPLAEETAAEVCVRIGKPAVEPIVGGITRWKLYPDPAELQMWLRALGRIGDPGAMPALNRALAQDLPGMEKLVDEVRAQIEKASGKPLPACQPDAVAFKAPAPSVASLDLDPGPQPPTTRPVNYIPENGVLFITLDDAFVRESRTYLQVQLVRQNGAWAKRITGRAARYNNRHHPGRLTSDTTSREKTVVHLEFAVLHDEHVPGGYAEQDVEIRATPDGMVGTYKGHFNYQDVSGSAHVESREGAVTWADEPVVASGEHPRLLFRAQDLPILRARAHTDFGRRVLSALRRQVAEGEFEDYIRHLEWTSNWTPGMNRAIAQSLFAQVFDDPPHGARAAVTAMVRMHTPAYGGEHGELQGIPLQIFGFGHDMAYPYWTPEEREIARPKVARMWSWIAPNSSVTHAGEGAYGLILLPILSLIREKGMLNLPHPTEGAAAMQIEVPQDAPTVEGIPVNEAKADGLITDWIYTTGVPDGPDDPLSEAGGAARANIGAGAPVPYKGRAFTFETMPRTAIEVTPGFDRSPDCISIPSGTSTSRTVFCAALKVTEQLSGVFGLAHPLGYSGGRAWISGREVSSGTPVILAPGTHRVIVEMRGKRMRPAVTATGFGKSRADGMRKQMELAIWEMDRDEHMKTGEMGEIRLYARNGAEVLRRHLWMELDNTWRTGEFGGGTLSRQLAAYQRVMGVPLPRDTPLPIREFPALALEQLSDESLCHAIQLAPAEIRPALVWEFNRRFLPDGLDRLPGDCLAAAFVNYPLETQPRNPDEYVPRSLVNSEKGGHFFLSAAATGRFTTYLYARSSVPGRPTREWSVAGFLRLRGFGVEWIADGGWRRGVRLGHEIQNIVEVEGCSDMDGVGKVLYHEAQKDGSGAMGIDLGQAYTGKTNAAVKAARHLLVDYSGKSGAPALVAVADRVCGGGTKTWTLFSARTTQIDDDGRGFTMAAAPKRGEDGSSPTLRGYLVSPKDARLRFRDIVTAKHGDGSTPSLEAVSSASDADFLVLMTVQRGAAPEVKVAGDDIRATVSVGPQTVRFDGTRLLAGSAGP